MMNTSTSNRRRFMKGISSGIGMAAIIQSNAAVSNASELRDRNTRLPREVWIATVSQEGIEGETPKDHTAQFLRRMKEIEPYQPDIVCLPEAFLRASSNNLSDSSEPSEKLIGPLTEPFAEYARNNRCYVICPIYTHEDGKYYNAAVIIDREGNAIGEYRKIRPTIGEMKNGVSPGPLDPPVFQTDFGTIGAQICFDLEWPDGWQRLKKKGAEIVFWASAFAGGKALNAKAMTNRYCVVTSTRKDTSKICDITGEDVAWTGRWNRGWVCAPVNLEKAFLHTWPYNRHFPEILAKYGRKIQIKTYQEEEWTIIESRSPDVKVADVLREFEMKTYDEHMMAAEIEQEKRREV